MFEISNYFQFLKKMPAFFFSLKYIVGAKHSIPKPNIRKCLLERQNSNTRLLIYSVNAFFMTKISLTNIKK